MSLSFENRTRELQTRLADEGIDVAVIHDPDNIFYLSAYWGYLSMQFGRPTLLVVPRSGDCTIITPNLESEMGRRMTWIQDVMEWADGQDGEWTACLHRLLDGKPNLRVGIEQDRMHPVVQRSLRSDFPGITLRDVGDVLADMRLVKTAEEVDLMRQAGQVVTAMCQGGIDRIAEGVPEYEIALGVLEGGTRKAAEFLTDEGPERLFSPMTYNLQVLQSGGPDLSMVHRRPTVRRVGRGESVYMCFCEMVDFKGLKLGFDRQYWVGEVPDEEARLYEITLQAQQAALDQIRPGVTAEEVHQASAAVYEEAGFGLCYRTGRGVGYSLIEKPQLKNGDKTVIQAGMTFSVDGAVSITGKGAARVGDSVVVTPDGFEYLAPFPKELTVL